MDTCRKMMENAGAFQYGFVDTTKIRFTQEVRAMCEPNTCQKYNKTWACPPAIGTVEECRARVQRYDKMLVFSVKCELEDSFDFEGMMAGGEKFKQVCRAVDKAVQPFLRDYLVLANEGCDTCKVCTYPDAPCRFPKLTHGSLEGYGIFVNELAQQAKINYINGANTVTYFGGIAFFLKDAAPLFEEQNG